MSHISPDYISLRKYLAGTERKDKIVKVLSTGLSTTKFWGVVSFFSAWWGKVLKNDQIAVLILFIHLGGCFPFFHFHNVPS